MIEKIIKLCEHICSGKYPIDNLLVIANRQLYINNLIFILDGNCLTVSSVLGKKYISNISDVDIARLVLNFSQVKVYSERLVEYAVDEALKETIKIDNVTDLNFDEQ